MSKLAENIKKMAELRGMSIAQLGRSAKLQASFIPDIIYNRKENPGVIEVTKIAECLGVTVQDLIGAEGKSQVSDAQSLNNIQELIKIISTLPPPSNFALLKNARALASLAEDKHSAES